MKLFTQLLFALTLFCYSSSFSQKIIKSHDLELKSGGSGLFFGIGKGDAEIIPLVNNDYNKFGLFIMDKKDLFLQEFDGEFNFHQQTQTEKESELSDPLGGYKHAAGYSIFFNGRKSNTYYRVEFNPESESTTTKKIVVDKKEKYLHSISDNNQFILLTVNKSSSIINSYQFTGNDSYKRHSYKLNDVYFKDNYYPLHFFLPNKLTYISQNVPSTFSLTHSGFKLYYQENSIYITFDNLYNLTEIIHLNLKDGTSTQKKLMKNFMPCQGQNPRTNSLIYKNIMYSLTVCDESLNLVLKDLKTGKDLTKFLVRKNDKINFKNSELIQDGGGTIYSTDRYLSLKNTKKFLSKTSNLAASIAISSYDSTLVLKLGGYKELTDYQPVGGVGFTYSGSGPPTYNPVLMSYQANSWSKTTYFKSILNKESFSHVKGAPKEELYSRIEKFENSLTSAPKFVTLFKQNNRLIYSYYDKPKDKLTFVEFK